MPRRSRKKSSRRRSGGQRRRNASRRYGTTDGILRTDGTIFHVKSLKKIDETYFYVSPSKLSEEELLTIKSTYDVERNNTDPKLFSDLPLNVQSQFSQTNPESMVYEFYRLPTQATSGTGKVGRPVIATSGTGKVGRPVIVTSGTGKVGRPVIKYGRSRGVTTANNVHEAICGRNHSPPFTPPARASLRRRRGGT